MAFADGPVGKLPLVLIYEASSGCPDQASFRREVEHRLRRPVAWLSEGDARLVRISLDARAEGVRGELEMSLSNDEHSTREVHADTCSEVATGLALVVALALDEEEARWELVRARLEPPPRHARLLPAAQQRDTPHLQIHAGPAFGAFYGPAPVSLVTLGATLGARYDTATWFSPTFDVTLLYAKTGVSGAAAPNASFAWATVGIDGCPTTLRLGRSVGALGCAVSHLGETIAEGRAEVIPFPVRARRFWADVGASLRLQLTWNAWFAEASAAGLVVLTHDEYVFSAPHVPVYAVPNLAYSWLFAFGARL